MRLSFVLLFLILTGFLAAAPFRILVLVPNNYGANSMLNTEIYEKYGWEITLAGAARTVTPCSNVLPSLQMDVLYEDIADIAPYDCIAIWPCRWWTGNPYGDITGSESMMALIRQADEANKILWTTCAGLRVLAAANVINGVRVQGRPGNNNEFLAEYQAAGAIYLGTNMAPVIDGNIVTTSRGQNLWEPNNEAIITAWNRLHGEAR